MGGHEVMPRCVFALCARRAPGKWGAQALQMAKTIAIAPKARLSTLKCAGESAGRGISFFRQFDFDSCVTVRAPEIGASLRCSTRRSAYAGTMGRQLPLAR